MKAINALRLLDERPEVAQIETLNHTENMAMLHINPGDGLPSGHRLAGAGDQRLSVCRHLPEPSC